MVALRRTDDGGRTMGGTRHWRGAAEYALWTERRQKGRKERGDGNALEGKNPGESWREKKKGRDQNHPGREYIDT